MGECRLADIPRSPIRFPRAGNDFYPLPPDYAQLNPEAQRAARLNAIGLAGAEDCTASELVWTWSFFRNYYLRQTPPGFFYPEFRESPPFHYQIISDIATYKYNAVAAPRGFSKSTVLVSEFPMLISIARPYFKTLIVLSSEVMVTQRMNTEISYQFQNNEFMLADFGDLKGTKGSAAWNAHLMQLPNGSILRAMSVKSSGLGARPNLILVDDVEFDPVLQKESTELSENYRKLLLNHFLPMLGTSNSSIYQIGTLFSKRSFLYYMLTTNDPQYEYFNRRLLDAEDDGHGRLLWPAKFSQEVLDAEKEAWTLTVYNAQRRNRPGTGDVALLPIHPQLAGYRILDADSDTVPDDPYATRASIEFSHGPPANPQRVVTPYAQFISQLFKVLTFDYAKCLTPTSDYRAFAVTGLCLHGERKGTWFILDLVLNREPGDSWVRHFWRLARKWRVQYSGIEAVAAQETLIGTANTYLAPDDFQESASWRPRGAVPITYKHGMSKEERIEAALGWRFRNNLVCLPVDLRNKWPWNQLYKQTEEFTGSEGATQFDDALDCVAMAHELLKGKRGSAPLEAVVTGSYNIVESLKRGETETPEGIQLGLGIMPQELNIELVNQLVFQELQRRSDLQRI